MGKIIENKSIQIMICILIFLYMVLFSNSVQCEEISHINNEGLQEYFYNFVRRNKFCSENKHNFYLYVVLTDDFINKFVVQIPWEEIKKNVTEDMDKSQILTLVIDNFYLFYKSEQEKYEKEFLNVLFSLILLPNIAETELIPLYFDKLLVFKDSLLSYNTVITTEGYEYILNRRIADEHTKFYNKTFINFQLYFEGDSNHITISFKWNGIPIYTIYYFF